VTVRPNHVKPMTVFSNIPIGQAFDYGGVIYIRTNECQLGGSKVNALLPQTGQMYNIEVTHQVMPRPDLAVMPDPNYHP
jgi:hypothetical protein